MQGHFGSLTLDQASNNLAVLPLVMEQRVDITVQSPCVMSSPYYE